MLIPRFPPILHNLLTACEYPISSNTIIEYTFVADTLARTKLQAVPKRTPMKAKLIRVITAKTDLNEPGMVGSTYLNRKK